MNESFFIHILVFHIFSATRISTLPMLQPNIFIMFHIEKTMLGGLIKEDLKLNLLITSCSSK